MIKNVIIMQQNVFQSVLGANKLSREGYLSVKLCVDPFRCHFTKEV